MFGITDVATYIIGTILVILLPGPNSLYCLSVSASHGIRSGYKAVAGIVVGDGTLILLTVLGAGTLLRLYPVMFNGMKLLGGLYLMYLGFKLLKGAYETFQSRRSQLSTDLSVRHSSISNPAMDSQVIDHPPTLVDEVTLEHTPATTTPSGKPLTENVFTRAILLSLTNPKAILFFLAFFVQFVDPTYPHPYVSFLMLAIMLQIISFSYLSVMVLAGKRLATRFRQYPWLVVSSMSLVGCLFIGFGLSLWMAQLN